MKPTDGELLDRLRELSRLPEVVNYRDWKAKILAGYKTGTEYEDWWHLLDGRTIHVASAQRPDGGLTYLYDDVTERFAQESRYNALIDVQRETLDSLKEGVAVFATDGRLKLYNSAFAQIWRLSRSTLGEGPHIDKIIAQCSGLYEDMATWARISRAVTGISDRRQPVAGQMTRPDQCVIDFCRLAAARRRHPHHLRRRDGRQALRADAARAQRGAGGGRPLEEPVHQPRVLRAENAADQHHRLQRAALQPAHGRAQRQAARIPERHLGVVAGSLGHHQRYPRPCHHRRRRAGAEAGPGQGGRHRRHGCSRRARPRQPCAPQSRHSHCRRCR